MGTVAASRTLAGEPDAVERRWYDTAAWGEWVPGLERIVHVSAGWPAAGGELAWSSGPAGRGEVIERVLEHRPGAGQTVAVSDGSITGRQTVAFTPTAGGVEVALSLRYRMRRRSPVTPLIDALFVRRAMAASLAQTLERFAARCDRDRQRGGLRGSGR